MSLLNILRGQFRGPSYTAFPSTTPEMLYALCTLVIVSRRLLCGFFLNLAPFSRYFRPAFIPFYSRHEKSGNLLFEAIEAIRLQTIHYPTSKKLEELINVIIDERNW